MLLILAVIFVALSVASAFLFLAELAPSRQSTLATRLTDADGLDPKVRETLARRRRQARAEKVVALLQTLGERVEGRHADISAMRLRLVQAGYTSRAAVPVYLGSRIALPIGLAATSVALLSVLGMTSLAGVLATAWFGAMGYIFPSFYIGSRITRRQKEMQKALPDALDLLVVCVEAGLGLNQALVRVSEEIERLSPVLSEQIALVNLEIRAGTPRDEAFRNMGDRTGLDDIRSLMAMLVQTDRFGTSVATALRVHADTMRTKRRQRAEEAAAKTTIKLVFPLVLFIFPAMFVVILGAALIQIYEALGQV
ncbi:MAG TPA: type II secretion system F family protein [Gemmatimonadales bacterium]|nr:type II secretion system F family protein [Gemmatimonadales bacterium]